MVAGALPEREQLNRRSGSCLTESGGYCRSTIVMSGGSLTYKLRRVGKLAGEFAGKFGAAEWGRPYGPQAIA